MSAKQKIAMMIICVLLFLFVLDLVRRRKLREEYSWLWLFTSAALFILVIQYSWLEFISKLIGAVLPTTTLFIGALVFLLFLAIQFSMRLSKLTDQVKNLVQENALMKEKIEEMSRDVEPRSPVTDSV
jgi:predicted membrane protein